jgi:hypothetical protein
MNMRSSILVVMVLAGAAALTACETLTDFPEPALGWHSGDYGVVFGRLQVVGVDAEEKPLWAVRFGESRDAYGGALVLTPAGMMKGFNGGESVEVRGKIVAEAGGPGEAMTRMHYAVDSIRLWSGYRE